MATPHPLDDPMIDEILNDFHKEALDAQPEWSSGVPDAEMDAILKDLGEDVETLNKNKREHDIAIFLNPGAVEDPALVEKKNFFGRIAESHMAEGDVAQTSIGIVELLARSAQGGLALGVGVAAGTVEAVKAKLGSSSAGADPLKAFTEQLDQAQDTFLNAEASSKVARTVETQLDKWVAAPLEQFSTAAGERALMGTKSPAAAAFIKTEIQVVPLVLGMFVPGFGKRTLKQNQTQAANVETRKTGDTTQPLSSQEKQLFDEATNEHKLADGDPVAKDHIQLVQLLDDGAEKQVMLEMQLKNARTQQEKLGILTTLNQVTLDNKALAGQITKNKVHEMQEFIGLPDPETKPKLDTFEITGTDKRTSTQLKIDLFGISTKIHSDGTPQAVLKQNYGDLTKFQAQAMGRITTNFATAEKHPLAKWTRDKIKAHVNRYEKLSDDLLNAPVFQEGLGITALRKAKKVSTDAGALTIYARSKRESQTLIRTATLLFDQIEKTPTKSWLTNMNLSPEEVSSVQSIRASLDTTRNFVNNSILQYGPEEMPLINKIEGYYPHVFLNGDFRVWVRDKDDVLVDVLPATALGHKRLAKKLQELHPDLRITSSPKTVGKHSDISVQTFAETMDFMQRTGKHKLTQQVRAEYEKHLGTAGFLKHAKERTGVGGFAGATPGLKGVHKSEAKLNKEFQQALTVYTNGAVRFAEFLRAKKELNEVFTDKQIKEAYPNATEWSQLYVDEAFGVRKGLGNALTNNNWFTDIIGATGIPRLLEGLNKVTSVVQLFMFNAKFLALQPIQSYQTMMPAMLQQKSFGVQSSAVRAMAEGHRAFFAPTPAEVDAIRFSIEKGSISRKFVEETMGADFFKNGILTHADKWADVLLGRAAAGKMDVWTRTLNNLVYYRHQINAGVSHEVARDRAAVMTDKHMVEYNHREVPLLLGKSSPLGPLAIPAKLFKSYAFNNLAQMGSFIRSGKKTEDYKPLIAYLATQAVVGGAKGLFLVKEVDALLEVLGLQTLTETLLESGLSDTIVYGPLSAGLDFDISASTQATSILPKEILTLPGLEWASKGGVASIKWIAKKFNPGGSLVTPSDTMHVLKSLAPKSFHGFIEKHYTGDGPEAVVPDDQYGGRGFIKRDLDDWKKRYLSGRSMRERRLMDSRYQLTRMNKRQKLNQDSLTQAAAYAYWNLDEVPGYLTDLALRYGFTTQGYAEAIKNKMKADETEASQRATQYGQTKQGRKNLQKLEEMGNTVYE